MSESVGELTATLSANTAPFSEAFHAAGQSAHESLTGSLITANLVSSGIEGAFGMIAGSIQKTIGDLGEVDKIMGQSEAVVKSTGGAANVTADQMAKLADTMERSTGMTAESIQQGENLLATFTNIKNGAGAGNDIFSQTTDIMADMAQAMGTDAKGGAIQLGKALNDPTQGVTALTRVGVTFTEGQKDQIKALQASGNTMGAQKLILAELTKEFGGSAEAAGKKLPGALARLDNAFGSINEALLTGMIPSLSDMAIKASEVFYKISDAISSSGVTGAINAMIPPGFQAIILGVAGAITASLIPGLITMATSAYTAASGMLAALVPLTPFLIAGAAVGTAAFVIMQNWTPISRFFANIFQGISGGIKTLYDNFKGAFGGIGTIVESVANFVKEKFGWLVSLLPSSMKNAIAGAGAALGKLPDLAIKAFGTTATVAGAGGKKIKEAFGAGLGKLTIPKPDMAALTAATKPGTAPKAPKAASGSTAATGFDVQADISKILGDLPKQMRAVTEESKIFGTSFDAAGAKASALKSALSRLAADGVGVTDDRLKPLIADWKKYQAEADSSNAKTYDTAAALAKTKEALAAVDINAKLFGDSTKSAAEKTSILENSIKNMVDNGVKPGSPAIEELTAKWAEFKPPAPSEMDKVSKALNGIAQEATLMGDRTEGSSKKIAYVKTELDRLAKSGKGSKDDMAALAKTLKDLEASAKTQGIQAFTGALADAGDQLQGMTSSVGQVANAFGVDLPDAITGPIASIGKLQNGFEGVGKIGAQMLPNLVTLFAPLAAAMTPVVVAAWGFTAAMIANPIGLIVIGVTGLIVGIGLLAKNWGAVTKAIGDSIGWIGGLLKNMAGAVGAAFGAIIKGIGDAFRGVFDFFVDMIKNFVNATVIGPINIVVRGLNLVGDFTHTYHIPTIPMLAKGGVTTKATMAMVGEDGPEAVLPLNESTFDRLGGAIAAAMKANGQQGAQGGQSNTYNVYTLAYTGDQASLQELARLIGIQQNQMKTRSA